MGDASLQPKQQQLTGALVVVLGDLGRSPRMVQHALSLAADGVDVVLAGYLESSLDARLDAYPNIAIAELSAAPPAPRDAGFWRFLTRTLRRVAQLHVGLARVLWRHAKRGGVVLVQNPPSLPTLWLAAAIARLRGARFVVDWHNFGFSMLALRFAPESWLVRWARRYELWAGRKADGAFCVSRAMQKQLVDYGVLPPPEVVYDRPTTLEASLDSSARSELLRRLLPDAPLSDAFLVCPTSWTADEDPELLLDALELREQIEGSKLPNLFILLTGKGPLREYFETRLGRLDLRRATVRTHFFDPADYRQILRAADLGLSLHRSSSGVDLPMKVIDFLGARTPVLALNYGPCLAEQVRDGVEGRKFRDAGELARLLNECTGPGQPEALRARMDASPRLWSDETAGAWRALNARWRRGDG